MINLKGERVASDMQKELGDILLTEAKDEDFKHVTITDCDVTNDLSFAKIYFTTTDKDRNKVEKELNNAQGFFRSLLAERLDIRHTPELRFIFDESIEYGNKIEKIIEEIHKEDEKDELSNYSNSVENGQLCLVFDSIEDKGNFNEDGLWNTDFEVVRKLYPIEYCPICGKKISYYKEKDNNEMQL